ncbi:MAG: MMPL family transporter [Candidatus Thermoplasmatota archaeon]|jgi:hypothetical protein|nr:MMPL family transporter [Candidatus Thermoplasmatota archaeon]
MEVLADFVERRAVPILIVILIISIFFFSMVPRISFKTDIRGFLPDNEMSQANARVMDYYGDAPSIHFILVKAINKEEDVLTPLSLKEQYKLVKSLKELDGVEETLSIADVVNILYQYRLDKSGSMTINRSRNISDAENADYEEIRTKLNLMFGILNGSYGEEIVSMFSDNFPMFSDNSLDNVKLLINLLFSKDFDLDDAHAKATIIIVNLDGGLSNDELKELARSIHERTDELQAELVTIELSHTGEYQIATEIDQATRDTMGVIVGAIFIVIAIMLYIGFRRGSYVILPLGILLLATVWTFGTAYIIGLKFSAVMVGVIPLIFGLGVDYPVHVSERYQEELGKGKKISIALKTAIKHVGGAIAICAISTAIGFFSNIISDVEPVRVFGITCAIGTSYAFILTLFFYCPARFLLDKRAKHNPLLPHKMKQLALEAKSRVKKKKHTLFTKTSYKFPGSIAIMALVITALAVLGTFNLESEFSMKDFLPDDWESLKTEEKIFEMFEAGSYTQSFILVESNSVATTEVYNDIRETIFRISDDSNIVSISSKDGDRLSLTEGIPRLVDMAYSLDPDILTRHNISDDGSLMANCSDSDIVNFYDFLYANNTVIEPLTGQTLAEHTSTLLHRNDEGGYDATLIRVYVNVRTSEDSRNLYSDLNDDVVSNGSVDFYITGGMILNIATLDSLQSGQIKATLVCIGVIGLMLILVYRKLPLGLIPLIPVILSTAWILGAMYVLGMSINVLTVTVTSLGIGMGIDYAVHVSERFREELKKNTTKMSVKETIGNLWRPLSISSMTTVAGFSVLLLTPIPIMASYGIICALSLVFSYTAAMFVLPVVLVARSNWSKHDKKVHKEVKKRPPTINAATITGHKLR